MSQDKGINLARLSFYKSVKILMYVLGICTWILIAIFLLPFAIPYIKNAHSFSYINAALNIEKSVSSFVQSIIPTQIAGRNITPLIVIIAVFFLGRIFSNLKESYDSKIDNVRIESDYKNWKAQMHLSDNAKVLIPLNEKLEQIQTMTKIDRQELLKLFADTKKKLEAMGKDLAFLAIDVVDSTGLKEGEEKASIEYDFKEYKNFVEGKLQANGVLKSAWTPDGVMSCFSTVDAAVKTAREVITGLDSFNKFVKTLKKDFRVRCGINAGYVYFDESIPLEEMSDRVIDIAGHMQKNALPNTICIAKHAIEPVQERAGFIPASKVIDGYDVYLWEKS